MRINCLESRTTANRSPGVYNQFLLVKWVAPAGSDSWSGDFPRILVAPGGCDSWSGDFPRILVAPGECDPPCVGDPAIININALFGYRN